MAGLTENGFTVKTLPEIKNQMSERLKIHDPDIDLDIASPDGQNVEIFSFIASQLWQQISQVYYSNDPRIAAGQALRNIGLLTGLPYGLADRSVVDVTLGGVAGTFVPRGSVLSDDAGNEFKTALNAYIPAGVQVIATQAGPVPVPANTITTINTVIDGFDSVLQPSEGVQGKGVQTPQQYRTLRNRTVMRNTTSVTDKVSAKLYDLGVGQASVVDNDHPTDASPDGTPAQTLHVVIGEVNGVSDEDIARSILNTKSIGAPTWSTSGFSVVVEDSQDVSHEIFFDKAIAVPILAEVNLTYLSNDIAGASDDIKSDMCTRINSLLAGNDVIWSHLFSDITKHGEAQVNSLTIGRTLGSLTAGNAVISTYEYAECTPDQINIVVV